MVKEKKEIAYYAIVDKSLSQETDFGVTFPDLPGCTTSGNTMAEAVMHAHDALQLYLEEMHQLKIALPKASAPETFKMEGGDLDIVEIRVPFETAVQGEVAPEGGRKPSLSRASSRFQTGKKNSLR